MSELLLDALMQLFALLTNINKEHHTGRAHQLINDYLAKHFNKELAEEYLVLYNEYLQTYHGVDFSDSGVTSLAQKELNVFNEIIQQQYDGGHNMPERFGVKKVL